MKTLRFLSIVMSLFLVSSCGIRLHTPSVTMTDPLSDYQYFYVQPTNEKTSTYNPVYEDNGRVKTRSVNPSDVISGALMRQGFTKLPELNQDILDKTFIVNYGETGRREIGLFSFATEITLQFVSADTHKVICVTTAEGCGDTEADDVRMAINRAMDALFVQE